MTKSFRLLDYLGGVTKNDVKVVAQAAIIAVGFVGLTSVVFWAVLPYVGGLQAEIWAVAIAEAVTGCVVLAILWKLRWLAQAQITTRPRHRGIWAARWSLLTFVLPALGMATTSWEPSGKIIADAADFLATGFYEELAYRGLILCFLARAWAGREHAFLWAAVVSGVLFGLVHLNFFLMVAGPMYALAFTWLQFSARTIWISMLLHAAYDWFSQFPYTSDGESIEHWSNYVALLFLVLAAVDAFRRLAALRWPVDDHDNYD